MPPGAVVAFCDSGAGYKCHDLLTYLLDALLTVTTSSCVGYGFNCFDELAKAQGGKGLEVGKRSAGMGTLSLALQYNTIQYNTIRFRFSFFRSLPLFPFPPSLLSICVPFLSQSSLPRSS